MSRKYNNNSKTDDRSKTNGNRRSSHFKKGNGTRNGKGRDTKEEAVMSDSAVKEADLHNDPNWYFTDTVVANQATQLSFNRFLGTDTSNIDDAKAPTVMVIRLNPCPGVTYPNGTPWALLNKSGFNMMSTKLFNRLSMKSGRNMNYAPQDVGMMLLAQGELLSQVSYIRRLFGVAQVYNMRNRIFPKNLIEMMGIDVDDFFKNFADYRMKVNTLFASLNQIPIMTNCGYFRKCMSLYSFVYTDCENSMSQIYLFVPHQTWVIDEQSYSGGTILESKNVVKYGDASKHYGVVTRTFKDYINTVFEPMVTKLLESSTLNLVYADLMNLATYDSIDFLKFLPVDESLITMPTYDKMVLKQIHNMTLMGWPDGPSLTTKYTPYNDVYPDPSNNAIKYNPMFIQHRGYNPSHGMTVVLDTDTDNPDIVERIEMTRYTSAFTGVWDSTNQQYSPVLTDHYGVFATIYFNNVGDNTCISFISTDGYDGSTNVANMPVDVDLATALEKFDWHPIVYVLDQSRVKKYLGDVSFFTTVDAYYLSRLNQIIYMGLFDLR